MNLTMPARTGSRCSRRTIGARRIPADQGRMYFRKTAKREVGEVLISSLMRPLHRPDLRARVAQISAQVVFDCSFRGVSSIRSFYSVALDMHRTVRPQPHHLRNAACIVAVRLVVLRFHLTHQQRSPATKMLAKNEAGPGKQPHAGKKRCEEGGG